MMRSRQNNHLLFLIAAIAFVFILPRTLTAETAEKAMVVTAHPLATERALEILKQGGNAVDAACAAQWVLNVVEPQSSGIGGGGFFLFYKMASKQLYVLDGREAAPRKAFPEMFIDKNGVPYPFDPERITGGLPVGVPGILKLLSEAHSRFGSKKITFAQLFGPAIEIAEQGFPISLRLASALSQERERLKLFESSRRIFLDEDGNPRSAGFLLKQPDLAQTFRQIQRDGISSFYEGEIAHDIAMTVRHAPFHPGLMEKEDLFYYKIIERSAIHGTYRGYDIFSIGPPSSGGTTLMEALNILEPYKMDVYGRSVDGFHLFSEAQRLAFQDRKRWIGDPGFVTIPVDHLVSKEFAEERAKELHLDAVASAGPVANLAQDSPNTSHISIVDEEGNMVAFTSTIEAVFGSGMVVPGRGFFLNNELTDFDELPKDENDGGKLKANAPGGEKRPRSNMTPVMIFREGDPVLVAGSPGGSKIIGIVLNVLVNFIDFGMSLDDAVSAPRMINRDGPLEAEPALFAGNDLKAQLEKKGQVVKELADFGNVQAIYLDASAHTLEGVNDPRGEGEAKGY